MQPFAPANSTAAPNRSTPTANELVPPARPMRSVAWVIAASSFAFAVIQLDVTIVNVALSEIGADLRARLTELEWVVRAYEVGFSVSLLSAGVVVDRMGAR